MAISVCSRPYASQLCGECEWTSPRRPCDDCYTTLRNVQDSAGLEREARDESTLTAPRAFSEASKFGKNEAKKFLIALSALPRPYRLFLRAKRTFDHMDVETFQRVGSEWAKRMREGCSTIRLATQANGNNPAVKSTLFESKTQKFNQNGTVRPKTSWYMWDDEDRVWFRCFTANPPWEGCLKLEVITLVESDEVTEYNGLVGDFFRREGIFDAFVKVFEPTFDTITTVDEGCAAPQVSASFFEREKGSWSRVALVRRTYCSMGFICCIECRYCPTQPEGGSRVS